MRICSSSRVRRTNINFAQHDFRAKNTSDPFRWLWVAILVLSCRNDTKPIATWSNLVFVFVSLGFDHLFLFFHPVEWTSFCFDQMLDFWAWKLINTIKTLFFAAFSGTPLFQLYFWWFVRQGTWDFRISTLCCIKYLFLTSQTTFLVMITPQVALACILNQLGHQDHSWWSSSWCQLPHTTKAAGRFARGSWTRRLLVGADTFGAVCATLVSHRTHLNIQLESWWCILGVYEKKRREKRICTSCLLEIPILWQPMPPFSSSDCLNEQQDTVCCQDGSPTGVQCICVYSLCVGVTGFGCLLLKMYSFQHLRFLFSRQTCSDTLSAPNMRGVCF